MWVLQCWCAVNEHFMSYWNLTYRGNCNIYLLSRKVFTCSNWCSFIYRMIPYMRYFRREINCTDSRIYATFRKKRKFCFSSSLINFEQDHRHKLSKDPNNIDCYTTEQKIQNKPFFTEAWILYFRGLDKYVSLSNTYFAFNSNIINIILMSSSRKPRHHATRWYLEK